MLPVSTESKYFEKILVTQDGQECRVIFLVSLVGGRIQAKIVSAEMISQPVQATILSLVAPYHTPTFVDRTIFNAPILSPYVKDLTFFISQPTRAPASK